MKQPLTPSVPASEDPDAWDLFWELQRKYEKYILNKRYTDYRKKYYAKQTEKRQIAKMKELMAKYPAEATAFLVESN